MEFIGIIPSRYGSSRFPGKPLVKIGDKSMIQRVYEQASKALSVIYVATDDQRIFDEVNTFGGKAVLTSPTHKSGTDRCAEAVEKIQKISGVIYDVVVNIQGDEPFIHPGQIKELCACFSTKETQIATLAKLFPKEDDIFDKNKVKVIVNKKMDALYFSRAAIPYLRDIEKKQWTEKHAYYLHIGMYAYRKEILLGLTKLSPSVLEMAESLEQLRWMENGLNIKVKITGYESIGIDTPDDLEKLKRRGLF